MENLSLKGLTTAGAEEKLRKLGRNVLPEGKRFRAVSIFFSQLKSFINLILFAAAILSFLIGDQIDAILIWTILLLNSAFGFIQEYKAERSLEKLKKLTSSSVRVIRNGAEASIDSSLIVPGDIVLLSDGERIPADGKIIKANRIEVDESVLTGESIPVLKKDGDLLFSGTLVSKGKAYFEVSETGEETKFGKIAKTLSSVQADKTPLEKKLIELGRYITLGVILISSLLIPLGIYKGEELLPLSILAISVAVSAIPEGLPAVVTIALAIGVSRMAKKKAIVRKMPAVETLGAVQLIITDKTGTLTENRMKVRRDWFVKDGAKEDIVLTSVLNNSASLVKKVDDGFDIAGDKTDGALLLWASTQNPKYLSLKKSAEIVEEYLFDTESKTITTVLREGKTLKVLMRGAPEEILDRSTLKNRGEVEKKIEEFAKEGLRVIGFGVKILNVKSHKKGDLENGIEFLGILGIYDPPRPEAKESIEKAKNAGVRTIMVTGDNEVTALAIAKEVGLVEKDEDVITGDALSKMSDGELDGQILKSHVFARITPEQKLRIVEAAKRNGLVVGVTGDGINDTLALKRADVGIAMGEEGSDVAKEASDIVLSDDNYATIVGAIEEGRKIYDNILKSITYLLTSNLSEITFIVLAFLLNFPLPLLPTQILWINLVTDGLPALALASDKKDPDILKKSPRDPFSPIFSRERFTFILFFGLALALILLSVFALSLSQGTETFARTVVFNLLVFSHMILAFIVRGKLLFRGNNFLLASVLFTLLLQVIITVTPATQEIFKIGF